ncbi:hypothetical protein ACWFRF_19515 [Nocardia sp. NPDC055165]
MSDLIQFLSDRDRAPWGELVGFVPDVVTREALDANHADLLLTAGPRSAVVEVKLGHLMSSTQQEAYESLAFCPTLYLAALASDGARLASDSSRWSFLSLSDLVGRWENAGAGAGRCRDARPEPSIPSGDSMTSPLLVAVLGAGRSSTGSPRTPISLSRRLPRPRWSST